MYAIVKLLKDLIWLYMFVVLVNAVLSWIVPTTYNRTIRQIYGITNRLTDPALAPIRRALAPYTRNIGIDFSPMVLFFILYFILKIF